MKQRVDSEVLRPYSEPMTADGTKFADFPMTPFFELPLLTKGILLLVLGKRGLIPGREWRFKCEDGILSYQKYRLVSHVVIDEHGSRELIPQRRNNKWPI